MAPESQADTSDRESYRELVMFTAGGFISGFMVAVGLDSIGWQRSPLGQWLVRTLAGEGESIFEGMFALSRRIRGAAGSMAEAYGWGKLLGMIAPWIIDFGSRWLGLDVFGVQGFYIPFFYAMSDQIGANISGLVYLRRKEKAWSETLRQYFKQPILVASLFIILIVPIGLLVARLLGFEPSNQVLTALETIIANLCWIPPLVGWLLSGRVKQG